MAEWWVHDLRRTAASGMARLGTPPHVIERVLNHISGSQSGVAGIYNRYGYLPEKRHALTSWSEYIKKIVADSRVSQNRYCTKPLRGRERVLTE